jgi:hypothetical protein
MTSLERNASVCKRLVRLPKFSNDYGQLRGGERNTRAIAGNYNRSELARCDTIFAAGERRTETPDGENDGAKPDQVRQSDTFLSALFRGRRACGQHRPTRILRLLRRQWEE